MLEVDAHATRTRGAILLALGCTALLLTGCSEARPAGSPDSGADAATMPDGGEPADARVLDDAAAPDADVTLDGDVPDAGPSCVPDAPLPVLGDFAAADSSHRWFRKSATATTFTVVPARPESPASLPRVFRVDGVCADHFVARDTDGQVARIDWSGAAPSLSVCTRDAATPEAAMALPAPGVDTATGCAGGPWTALTEVTP